MDLLYRFTTLGQNVFSVDFKFSPDENPDALYYVINSIIQSAGRINIVSVAEIENFIDFNLCELLNRLGLTGETQGDVLNLYQNAKRLPVDKLKLLTPAFDKRREVFEGVYTIWIGDVRFCNNPIRLGGLGRFNTVVRAIQSGTIEAVRGEPCSEPLMKEFITNDDRDYFSKWLEENCDVDLIRIRERLGFRDLPIRAREKIR